MKNMAHPLSRYVVVAAGLLLCLRVSGTDQASGDFEVRRRHLQNRYADFYRRMNEQGRQETSMNRFADEKRKDRQVRALEAERRRQEFVKNRRPKIERDSTRYEAELREQQKAHERARASYSIQQRRLRELESREGHIPDWIEYETYDKYEIKPDPSFPRTSGR
jgi:hypothetical protein